MGDLMGNDNDPQTSTPRPADHSDRVLRALEDAARADTELSGRVDNLERRVADLEGEVKDQMGTMNAHLDNIAREASKQTGILHSEAKAREAREEAEAAALEKKEAQEAEDRENRQKLMVRIGVGLWELFKSPLATLLTAFVAWLIYWYLWIPS